MSETALLRSIELNAVEIEQNRKAFNWGRIAAADPAFVSAYLNEPDQSVSGLDSLDDTIKWREDFLTGYQDEALSDKYSQLVLRVRDAESIVAGDQKTSLTEAVARAYFKTLAYKDEYEVARLHVQPEFLEKARRDYGGKARLRFHLAPPFLSAGTDSRGRPRKREFGAWIIPLFHLLAKLRSLRGTKLDLFGMTRERKMERALINDFETRIDQLINGLTTDNHGLAVEIVNEYMEIRGFGLVKEKAVEETKVRIESKFAGFLQVSERAA